MQLNLDDAGGAKELAMHRLGAVRNSKRSSGYGGKIFFKS